jgi:uncharacterized protein YdeI (YjbR/CyaY-like superfamily)
MVADAVAWRAWLAADLGRSPGVWLVLAKGGATQPTALTYDQALDEALCFGWIDGQLRGRDECTFLRRFTPRRPRSAWSQRNVEIVERLRRQGRMMPAGDAAVEEARSDGRWARAYAGAKDVGVPADLAAALAADDRAAAMFEILTSANRFAILYRIHDAKSAATRGKRIDDFVRMLASGRTPHPQKRRLVEGE